MAATPTLISADASLHLIGTRWALTTMDGTAVPTDTNITLAFGEGNRASGWGGCNAYEGEYAAFDTAISFGPIITTMQACPDPAGSTETTYLGDLAKVTTWAVPADSPMGTQLTLTGADGKPSLVFGPVAPNAADLAGTHWTLFSMDGTEVGPDVNITLALSADNTAGGFGGCNTYGADYIAFASYLVFGPIRSTLAACPDPAGSTETTYLADLAMVRTWAVPTDAPFGSKLTLSGPSGTPTLDFVASAPAGASLAGTSWTLTTMGGTAAPADVTVTIDFTSDVEVSGSGGCNNYFGSYVADATSIAFGPMASTLMLCPDPAGATEATYMADLAKVTTWAIGTDGSLTLSGPSGDPALVYAPAG